MVIADGRSARSPQSLSVETWLHHADWNFYNGWTGPIPIGKEHKGRYKDPWIASRHGWDGVDASPDEFDQLAQEAIKRIRNGTPGILSLGERLPEPVLGIDVDAYDGKKGRQTLEEWTAQFGPLPPTHTLTARFDGVSGIKLYRTPVGFYPKEIPNSGVEFLDRYHRYIVAPPSWHHTGYPYRLLLPNGKDSKTGLLPSIDEICLLPQSYIDGLPASATKAGRGDATDSEIADFAAQYDSGPQPEAVDWVLNYTIKSDNAEGTYGPTRHALCWAAREAKGKRFAWLGAVEKIRAAAIEAYDSRGERLDEEQFHRLMAYAIGEVRDTDEQQLYDNWQTEGFNQDPTAPSESEIQQAVKRLNINDEARRRRNLAVWEDPPDQGDALQQYLTRPPQPDWLVKEGGGEGPRPYQPCDVSSTSPDLLCIQ